MSRSAAEGESARESVGVNAPESVGSAFNTAGRLARTGSRPVLAQAAGNTCGPTCVGMILDTTNAGRGSTTIIHLILSARGTSMDRLAVLLKRNGVNATWRAGVGIDDIAAATTGGRPLIAAVGVPGGGGHSVVVDGVTKRMGQRVVAIRDPYGGIQYFELASEFADRFLGQVVMLP